MTVRRRAGVLFGALLGARDTRRSQWSTSGMALWEVVQDVMIDIEKRPRQVDGLALDVAAPELR